MTGTHDEERHDKQMHVIMTDDNKLTADHPYPLREDRFIAN